MKYAQAVYALYRKELHDLTVSPAAYSALFVLYVGLALPFVGSGYWFSAGFSDFRSFFLNFPLLFTLVFPLLTMNSWADEKKSLTDRLLFSFPVPKICIALGKYAALCVWWLVMLAVSVCIPLSVLPLVYFDFFSFVLSYTALLFFGAALLAFSLALAGISVHTPVSFLLSFFTCIFFSVSHVPAQFTVCPAWLRAFLRYCSFPLHYESAARGILDTRDFVFYIVLILSAFLLQSALLAAQEQHR